MHRARVGGFHGAKDLLFGVIRALTAAIDAKDPYTSGHSERVARIAVRIGQELGMPANEQGDLYLMGLLHDVGKIGVEDIVLKKPGKLKMTALRVGQDLFMGTSADGQLCEVQSDVDLSYATNVA